MKEIARASALAAALAVGSTADAQERPAASSEPSPAAPYEPSAAAPGAPPATPPPQAPAPAPPADVAPPAKPPAPPAPAAARSGPSITMYGFVLLSGFFNSGPFSNKDNANQVRVPAPTDQDGSFVASARGTRIGLRLGGIDSGLLRAKLSGVAEFDFKGGHFGTNASSWNAFVPRLRLAFARADWSVAGGVLHAVAGQDWGLLLNLNPNTVSYSCDPVFVQSGNLYRRTPQLRVGWDWKGDALGFAAAVAALSPADADNQPTTATANAPTSVDNGAGNKSRQPDVEGRVALSAKAGRLASATVGVGTQIGKRRYFFTEGGVLVSTDVEKKLLGVDADLTLGPFLQVKGEYYDAEGAEDGYTGAFPGVFPANPPTGSAEPAGFGPVTSTGWWAQATLKPIPALWLAAGYGESDATRSRVSATAANTRHSNEQLHAALIFNASKALRLSVEGSRTTSRYVVEGSHEATQLSFGSQLLF